MKQVEGHSRTGKCRGGTSQYTERNQASEGYSRTAQRERQVKIPEKTERARGTHELESIEGEPSQDMGRNRASEGVLTRWRAQRGGTSQNTVRN
jgi:hypothetical protein